MRLKSRFPLFEIVLATVILVIHAHAALSDAYNMPNSWFTRDDAYYYFKVAQNITEGHGVTFDGINRTNGYHPLWLLVCIPVFALARFDVILPLRVLLMVMALLSAATSILIYRLSWRALTRPVAILAASFWAFNSYIHYILYEFGLETPLAAFTIIWLVNQLSLFEATWRVRPVTRKQIAILALIAALVLFSRLDLVFFTFIVGIWILFRGLPIRFLLPLDMLIIFLSMTSALALRTGFPAYYLYMDGILIAVIFGLITKTICLYFFGAYQHPNSYSPGRLIGKTVLAITVSTAILFGAILLLNYSNAIGGFPRIALLIDWGISIVLMLGVRFAARWFGGKNQSTGSQNPVDEIKNRWKQWFAEGSVFYGILGGSLSLYMLYNRFAFGTTSPVSGQIKRWWGSLMETVYESPPIIWPKFLGLGIQNEYDAWRPATQFIQRISERLRPVIPGTNMGDERYYFAMTVICVVAVLLLIFNPRRTLRSLTNLGLIPLIAGCGIQILSYTTTGYTGVKEWYWAGQIVFVVLAGSLLVDVVVHRIEKYDLGRAMTIFVSVWIAFFLGTSFGNSMSIKMPHNVFAADRPYMEVLPFIEEATPAGSVIGMTGGGNVGYFIQDRTIVNMDGLINSYEYFQALKNGEAATYLKQNGMDIVFANPGLLTLPPYFGQFNPYLESYGAYGGKDFLYLLEKPKYQPHSRPK
jgi:hypothetical protein